MEQMFSSKENAAKTFRMVEDFVYGYIEHKDKMPLRDWLIGKMSEVGVWGKDVEQIADIIIEQAQMRFELKQAYEIHIAAGRSEESFIASYVEKIAKDHGITNEQAAKYVDNLSVGFDERLKTDDKIEWNEATRIENAELISKKASVIAIINILKQAKSESYTTFKNFLNGRENPSFQEALEKIIINAGANVSDNVGLNAAITGGFMSAAKSGFVKLMDSFEHATESIPVIHTITSAAAAVSHAGALAIDSVRIAFDFATGKIQGTEAISRLKESAVVQNLASLGMATKGALIGASVAAIPVIGMAIAPITTIVGGLIGALVGNKVGKFASEGFNKIKENGGEELIEKVTNFAGQTVKKAADFLKTTASTVWNFLNKQFA